MTGFYMALSSLGVVHFWSYKFNHFLVILSDILVSTQYVLVRVWLYMAQSSIVSLLFPKKQGLKVVVQKPMGDFIVAMPTSYLQSMAETPYKKSIKKRGAADSGASTLYCSCITASQPCHIIKLFLFYQYSCFNQTYI